MKQKVNLSLYCKLLTAIVSIILLVILHYSNNLWSVTTIGLILLVWIGLAFYFMPVSVSVDDKALHINRLAKTKTIPYTEISSITPMQPTMGEQRLFGSAGWFGYWGWFKEKDLGKYFAYYGKASECFLVRLKNGSKYMLGCEDPQLLTGFVSRRLPNN